MRALVVGASGQVGNALCDALVSRGHVVMGTYARTSPDMLGVAPANGRLGSTDDAAETAAGSAPGPGPANPQRANPRPDIERPSRPAAPRRPSDLGRSDLPPPNPGRLLELRHLDITDHAAIGRLVAEVQPQWIFCPAGQTHVDYCEDHPEEARRINRDAPAALARVAAGSDAGFVFYSSDYVFDGRAGPYAEDDTPNPLSVYGRSKWEGEHAVLDASPRAIVIRTTGVYGPEPQEKNFVYQLLRRLRAREPMLVPDDQISTPTYNRDLAAASVALAERGVSGVYHVAGSALLDRHAFAVLAAGLFGLDAALLVATSTASLGQRAVRPLRGGLRVDRVMAALAPRLLPPAEGLTAMRGLIAPSRKLR
jgi:dTDP-4-dehydrorhamnose reductase